MTRLGRIEKVNPREIWKHEALDFTKWLSKEENINLLCEELEISVENIRSEASAGRYNVDIVADDIETGRKVIIENQLECTDHKHLGQILTYSSAYDASIIIWIVTDYTEEHRQAIDWFNENINENINFFLVQIEVHRIGDSLPAPNFNIISQPNNWGKTVRSSNEGNKKSDLRLMQSEYWDCLVDYSKRVGSKLQFNRKGRPHFSYDVSFGSSKCNIALIININKGLTSCGVYIPNDKTLYNKFLSKKEDIERDLGFSLEWSNESEKSHSKVSLLREADLCNRQNWNDYFSWMVTTSNKFAEVFKKYL